MSFHGFIAHFFLALNNIPMSECTTVYQSIHHGEECHGIKEYVQFCKKWPNYLPKQCCQCSVPDFGHSNKYSVVFLF